MPRRDEKLSEVRGNNMRVTGLGHAGMHIDTKYGSILCDPWKYAAFFGSWFPFPDNTIVDWEKYGKADYLYISHRHRDHFDPRLLHEVVDRKTPVLLPDYPTRDLERDLIDLGYTNLIRTKAGEPFDLDGLRVMVTPMRGPSDGPLGDSALSVDDGETIILNQNDSHPLDVAKIKEFGHINAYFTQVSGAIWWPMVYELPLKAKQTFAKMKRDTQSDRATFYIDSFGADHAVPIAGPPCFLDDDLFEFNGYGKEDTSIFTDQVQFIDHLKQKLPEAHGVLFLPGTVMDIHGKDLTVEHTLHTDEQIEEIFHDKWNYLENQRSTRQHELVEERESRIQPSGSLFEELKALWEPFMKQGTYVSRGIGANVRFDVGDESLILDFPNTEVRRYNGEQCKFHLSVPADLIATNLRDKEIDWSNSIFLSLRFKSTRIGKFNEFLYTFFKCLSEERMAYCENWYAQQESPGGEVEMDGWLVQRKCPHLGADLSKFGHIEDGVMTCNVHKWRFDLESGQCLSTAGHGIKASRIEKGEPAVASQK